MGGSRVAAGSLDPLRTRCLSRETSRPGPWRSSIDPFRLALRCSSSIESRLELHGVQLCVMLGVVSSLPLQVMSVAAANLSELLRTSLAAAHDGLRSVTRASSTSASGGSRTSFAVMISRCCRSAARRRRWSTATAQQRSAPPTPPATIPTTELAASAADTSAGGVGASGKRAEATTGGCKVCTATPRASEAEEMSRLLRALDALETVVVSTSWMTAVTSRMPEVALCKARRLSPTTRTLIVTDDSGTSTV